MGFTTRRAIRKSVISFERAHQRSETDLADFSGTISCGPSNDKTSETLSDWQRLDYDNDRGVDETGER